MTIFDVGGEAGGDLSVGGEADAVEMCPLLWGESREVLLKVRKEALLVDCFLGVCLPKVGVHGVVPSDDAGATKGVQGHVVFGEGVH